MLPLIFAVIVKFSIGYCILRHFRELAFFDDAIPITIVLRSIKDIYFLVEDHIHPLIYYTQWCLGRQQRLSTMKPYIDFPDPI